MAEKIKIPRLGKAASEYNVSTATIVNFLSTKGFEVKDEPNTKLTEEMYALLVAEYQKEKDIKDNSVQIGKAGASADGKPHRAAAKGGMHRDAEPVSTGEVFVKETVLHPMGGKSVARPEPARVKPQQVNLDEPVKRSGSGGVLPSGSTPAPEPVPAEKPEKADVEPMAPETPVVGPAVQEKPAAPVVEQTEPVVEPPVPETVAEHVEEEKEIPETKAVEEQPVVTAVEEEPVAPEQQEVESPSQGGEAVTEEAAPEPEEAKPELFRPVKPVLSGVKTIGHIDLTEVKGTKPSKKKNRRKKESKESKEQKEMKGAKKQAPKNDAPEKERQSTDNFIRTEAPRLAGTRVISQMDLDSVKSKPDGESGGETGKKKRARISKSSSISGEKGSGAYEGKERQGKSKGKDKKQSKYKVDFTDEEITEQIRKTYSGMAPVKKSQASKHRKEKREHIQQELMEEMERNEQEKSVLKVTEFITANELATMMNKPVTDIISVCMSLGLAVAINQRLSAETISLLAENYGFTVQFVGLEEEEEKPQDREEDLVPRAPIITVMGHVDHGKTSLLDYIRNTNVIQGEAGGITQHIGAYEVKVGDKSITFLDTPGHEAFTAMRARGASITDIVIIVIAADDQIMPQTIEAINHAQAAGVPMIFAINKIDKPGADPERIRAALANMNILVEEWGGKVQSQDISAKKGTNVDLLLEKVLIEAEMLDLKANPKAEPTGTVIESSLDKGRGYVAKILVQNGTLRTGDIIAAGTSYGKIRAMYNEKNQIVKEAGPSVPVLLLGLNSAPQAGDTFRTYKTDKEARAIVNKRSQLLREQGLRTQKHITLDELGRRIAVGDFQELNVIVKGDVDGSIEALSDEILKLSTADVQVNVIHKSVGQVTESDVLLASASNAIIIAFQVRPSSGARKLAEQEQVDIRVYSVLYSAIDDLKAAIAGMKAPEVKEQVVANLEVRETFRISKVGVIAGCYVLDGKIQRSSKVRVIRDGIVIHDNGRLGSLKRFKDDAKEVSAGLECGLNIESFNDVVVGDQIEAYEEIEVPVK